MNLFLRKLIAIFLSISILGGVIHMDEETKVPMLFKHFKEHTTKYRNDSVFTFLYKHYISAQKVEADWDKSSHSQLPFKSTKKLVPHYFPFCLENNSVQYGLIPFIKLYIIFTTQDSITDFSTIWQPPKVI